MLSLFFPIRYGEKFIIQKRILNVYLTEIRLSAVLILANGFNRTIIKSINFDFEEEQLQNASYISSLISKLINNWSYDYSRLILASNLVIFKSINSPFLDIEKVKMTIPFELESLLPFPLSEASVDVVFQNKNIKTEKNLVLAVISKEESINYYREVFKNANIKLDNITIDAIELLEYDFFTTDYSKNHIVMYHNGFVLLLFLYHLDGLVTVKYIDLKKIINKNELTIEEQDKYFYIINQTLVGISQEFNFSLVNCNLYSIGITENDFIIKKLIELYKFDYQNYITDNQKFKNLTIIFEGEKTELLLSDSKNNFLLISSLLLYKNEFFNLAHKENTDYKNKLLFKQIIVAIILTIFIFAFQIIFNFISLINENKKIDYANNKIIQILKKEFDLSNKYLTSIDKAYQESEKIVSSLEENLPVIAIQKKFLLIEILSVLNKFLINDNNGLIMYEIKWKLGIQDQSTINLIGEVKDFESLHILEENLKKTNLFLNSSITQQQDLHFNFNLILL